MLIVAVSAYIAASRRSDRSLEARIESARRASEIHKKRTGRALRVTEQDVINEEMYEEEDDDLPTQYQRLNAHLHTTSVMFNKKLHDYIATQHGVRNMFMSQYQNQTLQPYGMQYPAQTSNWLNPSMPPPQQFTATSPQVFQQAQPYSPTNGPQQGFRQAPYHIPQRPQVHPRSLSIQLPNGTPSFDLPPQHTSSGSVTPQGGINRRMSLPPRAFEQSQSVSGEQGQVGFSRSPSNQSPTSASPTLGVVKETQPQTEFDAEASYTYSPPIFSQYSQAFNANPLSFSLPPESQQLIGSALDPNDPRTAMFMSGSNNIPQPFDPTYRYQPNASKPTSTASGNIAEHSPKSAAGLSIKLEKGSSTMKSTSPGSISEGFFSTESYLTPGNGDYNAFFDFQAEDLPQSGDESGGADQVDVSNFVNWD